MDEAEHLGEVEGLAGQMGDLYAIIAEIYLDMGDRKRARKLGRLAIKNLQHYAGFDNLRTDKAAAFMRELDKLEG